MAATEQTDYERCKNWKDEIRFTCRTKDALLGDVVDPVARRILCAGGNQNRGDEGSNSGDYHCSHSCKKLLSNKTRERGISLTSGGVHFSIAVRAYLIGQSPPR